MNRPIDAFSRPTLMHLSSTFTYLGSRTPSGVCIYRCRVCNTYTYVCIRILWCIFYLHALVLEHLLPEHLLGVMCLYVGMHVCMYACIYRLSYTYLGSRTPSGSFIHICILPCILHVHTWVAEQLLGVAATVGSP